MTSTTPVSQVQPLLDALAAEYAAVFAYGAVGAHVTAERRSYVSAALASHRAARDWLRDAIVAAGVTPPPAPAAFELPEVTDEASAEALAAQVELATVPRWSAVAGVVSGPQRPFCTSAAQSAAVRALTFGAPPQDFPGIQQKPTR